MNMDTDERRQKEVGELLERQGISAEDIAIFDERFDKAIGLSPPSPLSPEDDLLDALDSEPTMAGAADAAGVALEYQQIERDTLELLDDLEAFGPDIDTHIFDSVPQEPEGPEAIVWDEETLARKVALIKATETGYMAAYKECQAFESDLKRAQEQFARDNAATIKRKKDASDAVGKLETELKALVREYTLATGNKKFDEYLSTKQYVSYEIVDRAAATTWAQEEFKAAIVETLNDELIITHLKSLDTLPAWARKDADYKTQISKKF
jgi:hypothetical protein